MSSECHPVVSRLAERLYIKPETLARALEDTGASLSGRHDAAVLHGRKLCVSDARKADLCCCGTFYTGFKVSRCGACGFNVCFLCRTTEGAATRECGVCSGKVGEAVDRDGASVLILQSAKDPRGDDYCVDGFCSACGLACLAAVLSPVDGEMLCPNCVG